MELYRQFFREEAQAMQPHNSSSISSRTASFKLAYFQRLQALKTTDNTENISDSNQHWMIRDQKPLPAEQMLLFYISLERAFQNSQLCQAPSWHFCWILQECHQVLETFVFKMERLGSGTSYGCRHGPVHGIFWTINLQVIISSDLNKLQKLLRINWIKFNKNTAKHYDWEGEIKCVNEQLGIIG